MKAKEKIFVGIFYALALVGLLFLIDFAPFTALAQILDVESKAVEMENTKYKDGSYKQGVYNGLYRIDVYETPAAEFGYQIIEFGDTEIISTGYGVEASERTFLTKWDKFHPDASINK